MRAPLSCLLLTALTFVGCTARAEDPTIAMQTRFYESLGRGDAETLLNQMHPGLKALVDLPVLEAWAAAYRDRLGGLVSTTELVTSRTQQLTCVETKLESEIIFEQGTATGMLRFLDDELVAFKVESDQLGEDWFQGPTQIEPYTEKANAFITAFLAQDAELARSLMHDALKEVCADGKLEAMMDAIAANGGALRSATLQSHRMLLKPNKQQLILLFDIECERASGQCEIEIQFLGMQGHLIGFDFE